jgi:(1->4)-alpha-D-glucan 1-alpha-D-glucosylmutase
VHGTTGYRFASVANGVFIERAARGRLDRTWRAFTGERNDFDEAAYQGKRNGPARSAGSGVERARESPAGIARADRRTRDYTFYTLRHALARQRRAVPV